MKVILFLGTCKNKIASLARRRGSCVCVDKLFALFHLRMRLAEREINDELAIKFTVYPSRSGVWMAATVIEIIRSSADVMWSVNLFCGDLPSRRL